LRCKDFAVLAWNCLFTTLFGEFLGNIFPGWRHPSSWPPKGPSLGGITSFELFTVTISATVRPGAGSRKKSITKKVTCVLYFPYLGGSPRWADSTLKLHGGWCRRHNHVCRVSNWNLHGLRFYRGSNFPIDFSMGLTTVQRYCAACDKAIYWSKIAIFHTSLVFDATIRGSPSDYCFPAWFGITRTMVKTVWRYVYPFLQNVRTWQTDRHKQRQTDRPTPHDGKGRAWCKHCAAKSTDTCSKSSLLNN